MVNGRRRVGQWTTALERASKTAEALKQAASGDAVALGATLDDVAEAMLEDAVRRGVSENTVRFYVEKIRVIRQHLPGATPIRRIRPRDLESYRDRRLSSDPARHGGRRPSASAIDKDFDVLRRLFRFATKRGWFEGDPPTTRVERSQRKREERKHYTSTDILELVGAYREADTPTSAWTEALTVLLFTTGLRASEVTRLHVRDLDSDPLQISVERKRSKQTLPVHPIAMKAALRLAGDAGPGELVYRQSEQAETYARSHAMAHLYRTWRKRLPERLAGHHNPHTFRHSFQTHLMESEAPVHHVATLMDHATGNSMTLRYAHATPDALRKTLSAAFDGLGLM
ncbi:MAG: tyrosine-type recombinase/integrase [Planctomycetota bacterium]